MPGERRSGVRMRHNSDRPHCSTSNNARSIHQPAVMRAWPARDHVARIHAAPRGFQPAQRSIRHREAGATLGTQPSLMKRTVQAGHRVLAGDSARIQRRSRGNSQQACPLRLARRFAHPPLIGCQPRQALRSAAQHTFTTAAHTLLNCAPWCVRPRPRLPKIRPTDGARGQSFFGFGPSARVLVVLNGAEERKKVTVKPDGKAPHEVPIYQGHEDVSGKVVVEIPHGKKLEHIGLKVELIGEIGVLNIVRPRLGSPSPACAAGRLCRAVL